MARAPRRSLSFHPPERSAIVATPASVTRRILSPLPSDTAAALDALRYGPYVVGAFLTEEARAMPWDELYALATPGRSFGMLFNTANVLRTPGAPRRPGGSLMVYAAAGAARALAPGHRWRARADRPRRPPCTPMRRARGCRRAAGEIRVAAVTGRHGVRTDG